VIILFFLQYYCIILWEEEMLLKAFPQDAEHYFRSVPRWLPNWPSLRTYFREKKLPCYTWSDVFRREQSTLFGLYSMTMVMIVKELLLD
jgi:hypothetical protein